MQKTTLWREFAAIGLILMSLSWLVPWFQAFTRVTLYPTESVTLVIGFILLAAYVIWRILAYLRLKTEIQVGLIGLLANLIGWIGWLASLVSSAGRGRMLEVGGGRPRKMRFCSAAVLQCCGQMMVLQSG